MSRVWRALDSETRIKLLRFPECLIAIKDGESWDVRKSADPIVFMVYYDLTMARPLCEFPEGDYDSNNKPSEDDSSR